MGTRILIDLGVGVVPGAPALEVGRAGPPLLREFVGGFIGRVVERIADRVKARSDEKQFGLQSGQAAVVSQLEHSC